MSKSPVDSIYKDSPEASGAVTEDDLAELRKILLEPEQKRLAKLQNRLDDPGLHASDVSRVLAEAIILRSARDNRLAKALEPTIAEAIRASIKKDRKLFADILLPVIGPAIRRAIASALRGMVESINQVLENSFSIRGLKWRLEALRTKRPFGEIVLLNSLVYRVEQVFLIHRNTGLTLQHVMAKDAIAQDPDLVSSMLTAIQDFVRDSFGSDVNDGIDMLHIGDRLVWIEQGAYAILAAVIQGNPPESLRLILAETTESIHVTHSEELESFDGNTAAFESTRTQLDNCIQSQFRRRERRKPILSWILLVSVFLAIVIWLSFFIRGRHRWSNYLETLNKTPGIVVVNSDRRIGADHISGLRDPLAADPLKMLGAAKLNPDGVRFHWEPYHSLHPDIVLKRDRQQNDYYADSKRNLGMMSEKINKQCLYFGTGKSEISPEHDATIIELASDIAELHRVAQAMDKDAYVEIVGHTDRTGLEEDNLRLSKKRADSVLSALASKGLQEDVFISKGVGSERLLKAEPGEITEAANRCVTFRVVICNPG